MYNREWYNSLRQSPITPPNKVFGIVWPILYILLLISFILTIRSKRCKGFCPALIFFIIQMVFNLLWTSIFFAWKQIILGFIFIMIMIILTIVTMVLMRKISLTATYLLIPYIIWLCFAGYLNGYIMVMNKI